MFGQDLLLPAMDPVEVQQEQLGEAGLMVSAEAPEGAEGPGGPGGRQAEMGISVAINNIYIYTI